MWVLHLSVGKKFNAQLAIACSPFETALYSSISTAFGLFLAFAFRGLMPTYVIQYGRQWHCQNVTEPDRDDISTVRLLIFKLNQWSQLFGTAYTMELQLYLLNTDDASRDQDRSRTAAASASSKDSAPDSTGTSKQVQMQPDSSLLECHEDIIQFVFSLIAS